ncbi:MAG TPA: hypothetical protein PKY31_11135 [Spirochaetota bacterium]|nr:hypothetical protein [Spirochaetota bacterium]
MRHRNGHHITRALSASGLLFAAGLLLSCLAQDFTFNDGFRVGGNVARNVGTVALKNTVTGETVSVTGSGGFMFRDSLDNGSAYNIVMEKQPDGQTCTVSNPSGTISGGDVNNVWVECSTVSNQASNNNLVVSSQYPVFETPSSAGSMKIHLGVHADVLVTMTSSVRTSANGVSYARLLVDGKPIAQGRASTSVTNAYPMTFARVLTMEPGTHVIAPAFASSLPPASGNMLVDESVRGIMTVTVLPTVPGYRRYTTISVNGTSVASSANNETIPIPGLDLNTGILLGEMTVIGILPLLETRWSALDMVGFDLLRDGATFSSGTASSNQVDEYIPITLFAAESFPVGTAHDFGAQCRITSASTSVVVENDFPTVLSGIFMDTITTQSGGEPTAKTFTPSDFSVPSSGTVYSESPVLSHSYTINSPTRLLVAVVIEHLRNNTAPSTTWCAIGLNNYSTIIGETSVSNNAGMTYLPLTIITTSNSTLLGGATVNINLYVKTSSAGSIVTGTGVRMTVMRLD